MSTPAVSVVLGSYNRLPFLKATIASVRDNGGALPCEIIVVEGGSTDGSLAWLSQQKDIITIIQHNRGIFRGRPLVRRSWGYFMNLGFKCAQGTYILMISDDCLLLPASIQRGCQHFERLRATGRSIGAVAFYWRNWPIESAYRVGLTFGDKMFVNHGLYLRQALEQIGWIDEDRYQFYHADGDLSLKLWEHGYEVVDCPDAMVEHFTHANHKVRQSNIDRQKQDWSAYRARWAGVFDAPDSTYPGGWLYRQYVDPYATATRFPRGEVLRFLARYGLGHFKRHRLRKLAFWSNRQVLDASC